MRTDLPDTSNQTIGQRITLARTARGYHAAAFARLLELTPQALNSYEKGRTTTPYAIIARVWQLTGATADYLVFGKLDGMPRDLVEALHAAEKAPDLDGRRRS